MPGESRPGHGVTRHGFVEDVLEEQCAGDDELVVVHAPHREVEGTGLDDVRLAREHDRQRRRDRLSVRTPNGGDDLPADVVDLERDLRRQPLILVRKHELERIGDVLHAVRSRVARVVADPHRLIQRRMAQREQADENFARFLGEDRTPRRGRERSHGRTTPRRSP